MSWTARSASIEWRACEKVIPMSSESTVRLLPSGEESLIFRLQAADASQHAEREVSQSAMFLLCRLRYRLPELDVQYSSDVGRPLERHGHLIRSGSRAASPQRDYCVQPLNSDGAIDNALTAAAKAVAVKTGAENKVNSVPSHHHKRKADYT
jgi:hypothetical protein